MRKWKALVRTPQLRGLAVKERPGWGNSWKGPGGQERDVSKAEKRLSSLKCWWPRARRERGGGRGRRGAPGGSGCLRGAGLEGAGAQCGVHPQGAGEGLLPRAKVEAAGVGRGWPGLGVHAPAGVHWGAGVCCQGLGESMKAQRKVPEAQDLRWSQGPLQNAFSW